MNRKRSRSLCSLVLLTAAALVFNVSVGEKTAIAQKEDTATAKLALNLRTKTQQAPDTDRYHTMTKPASWAAKETAIVICDMWDKHWCPTATARVAEMAPRMNKVVNAARKKGVLIIHCPSDTLDFYKDYPQRKLAMDAPKVETKIPLQGWCHLIADKEGTLPIDDSDGGCDCTDQEYKKNFRAWSRQIETIEIKDNDAITDSAEAFYLMKQRGIKNVIIMGVHTNMCVLGRPFSIRQMVQQGQNVVLMRDMTDTMYNPAMSPYVSHFTGTDLIIDHIEKYWCPTITSADILGGKPFRFKNDKRKHVVIVCAEQEYKTNESLPKFAKEYLGKEFKVSFVFDNAKDRNDLPGLDVLNSADVLLLSVRRRVLPKDQMKLIQKFIADGNPVVGIRTASHAFSLRKQDPPEGLHAWPEFDKDVFGGNYNGHHANGTKSTIDRAQAIVHTIIKGIHVDTIAGHGSLYKVSPLQEGTRPLLLGTITGHPSEPVAWTNMTKSGGRAFYTSLGHVEDFKHPEFNKLLANAVRFVVGNRTKN